MLELLFYIFCGAVTGFLSGLLGIGGGLVVVPALSITFEYLGIASASVMHMAVATSMATMLFTAVRSAKSHAKHKTVLSDVVKAMMLPIMLGTFIGSYLGSLFSLTYMKIFFTGYLFLVATQMFFDLMPEAKSCLPKKKNLNILGVFLGMISGVVGLGGGSLFVPFLRYCGQSMHMAVGTSSALAWSIAASGTLGYFIFGYGVEGLPEWSFGYIYLPALLCITLASLLFVPLGVRVAYAVSVSRLRKMFAIFLYITAFEMLSTVF